MKTTKYIQLAVLVPVCLLYASFADAADREAGSYFKNEELLDDLFVKLYELETDNRNKVNIVHIGDSHIQADFFSGAIREALQDRFGNGGYGFTFPYSLAKTNGTNIVRYKSNVQWQNSRSAGHSSSMRVGLSGIGLQTTAKNFYIELETSSKYSFNTIKVLSSVGEPCFGLTLSLAQKQPVQQLQKRTGSVVQQQHHTVKKGETLYRISVNYNTTVEALKKENSLTSDIIEIGQDIRIPRNSRMNYKENEAVSASGFFVRKNDTLSVAKYRYVTLYNSMQPLTRIYVVRGKNEPSYNLSGFVLEKSMKGVIYHAIGVNGAKTSDFNRYPIFFDQLSELNPDLVIISLGTNESFGKWVSNNYMYELSLMIKNIRERNRNVPVLVMTPPPSMLRRNQPNTFIESYSKAMLQMDGCAVWDLFSGMGGISAPSDKNYAPLMAKDKIHYTRAGYRVQAEIFSSALLDAYNKYIKTNCN